MRRNTGLAVIAIHLFFSLAPAQAAEPCLNPQPGLSMKGLDSLDSLLKKIQVLDPSYTNIWDGHWYYDVSKAKPLQEFTTLTSSNIPLDNLSEWARVYALYNAAIFPQLTETAPATFSEYLHLLKQNRHTLSINGKLILLSMIGSDLAAGYDLSKPSTITEKEALFQNLRRQGTLGGVCRDIHAFLRDVSEALGFETAGTHSGIWKQTDDFSGNHLVMHFRNPATGEYYIQNYSQIFNTHEIRLDHAIDISTAVLSPFVGTSVIENTPGRMHLYQPRTSRWVTQLLESGHSFQPSKSLLTTTISNKESTVMAQISAGDGKSNEAKAFFIHSDYRAAEGDYQVNILGASYNAETKKTLARGPIDEIGIMTKLYGGHLSTSSPKLFSESGKPEKWSRDNIFLGAELRGTARINQVTGRLELNGTVLDYSAHGEDSKAVKNTSTPPNAINIGAEYRSTEKPISVDFERKYNITTRSTQDVSPALQLAHDRIDVVFDSRKVAKTKAYVVTKTGLYALDGIDRMSALGIKNTVRASLPTEKKGEFSVVYDMSDIVNNRTNDPFFDVPKSETVSAIWKKQLNKHLDVTSKASWSNGNDPFYLFEEPGSATPELSREKKETLSGMVWINTKF